MPGSTSPKPIVNPAPLARIQGLSDDHVASLNAYWITSIQEFLAVAELPDGRHQLALILELDDDQVTKLVKSAERELPPSRGPEKAREDEVMLRDYGTGALEPPPAQMRAVEEYETIAYAGELPALVDYTASMPAVRNQGVRGTCVAYAAAAVREFLEVQFLQDGGEQADATGVDLSEQFIYWWCKEQDHLPHVSGTYPHLGMECLAEVGAPPETIWPYDATPQPGNEGQGPPPAGAEEAAVRYRIKRVIRIDPKDVASIKAALADGKAILFTIPVFNSWFQNRITRRYGKINMPLPGEKSSGAHAMALVGYVDDENAPGGGYFLLRNAWSPWGYDNPQGEGFGSIPYAFIATHNLAADTGDRASTADVYIRDNVDDRGETPSAGNKFNSPDIWLRRNEDGREGHQIARPGETNWLYVRAWNLGPQVAKDVRAALYQAQASPSIWPEDWREIGEATFTDIPAGESATTALAWTPPDAGPHSFFARISSADDPVQHEWSVRNDNNVAQKSLIVLRIKPGARARFRFVMHAPPGESARMNLDIDRRSFEKGRVELQMVGLERARSVRLIEDEARLANLALKSSAEQEVKVTITADDRAKPGELGEIVFTQHYGRLLIGRLIAQVEIV
ncbi:MAG TPA: C1 family peptidase [Caldilineae bacterium]|nr:C1 family peptidase [Caldilineae bacterium]